MSTCITFKEGELEKSKNTLEGLNREHQQLAMNLEKIEALEDKIKTEMTTLKEKMGRMDEEMVTFSDLDRLRQEAEEKRQRLEQERTELQGRREGVLQAKTIHYLHHAILRIICRQWRSHRSSWKRSRRL